MKYIRIYPPSRAGIGNRLINPRLIDNKAIKKRKLGKPNEIAEVVNFLASDQANYITGQTIHVNGGLYM